MLELFELAGQQAEQERAANAAIEKITRRERDILQALAEGLNDKAIAQRRHISIETVRTHMVNLLAKLEVESRLQAHRSIPRVADA